MMVNFQEEAMLKLGATAPELVSLVVSFRDLSEDLPEGGNTSVGVFILKGGTGLFFVPVVAKGNTVYPIDSVFDDAAKKFKPLTNTYVQRIVSAQGLSLGQPTIIPRYIERNPSIYNLIVPPRTGKYAYASTGLFGEFVATLPQHLKQAMQHGLEEDKELTTKLASLINLPDVLEALATNPIKPTTSIDQPEVQIYTAKDVGRDLTDAVIQDILNLGYHIKGDNVTPRVAIEAGTDVSRLTQLRGATEGNAYEVLYKDGTAVRCMVPKMLKRQGGVKEEKMVGAGLGVGASRHVAASPVLLAITEYGDYFNAPEAVLKATPSDVSEVASELYALAKVATIMDVENGDYFVIATENGVVGPFRASNVAVSGTMSIIQASEVLGDYNRVTITASTGFKGKVFIDGNDIFVSSQCTVIELGQNLNQDVETSINGAANKIELKTLGLLENKMEIRSHGNGFFSVNGRELGDEAELAKMLIVGQGIAKQASLGFIKSAKENKRVTIYLTKKASDMDAIPVGDIPEYGQSPTPQDEGLFNPQIVDQATQTRDPGIVESTIISQFLQDPSMLETISSYLPSIEESLDKIGRTLLLLRINGDMETSEDIAALITSLRNTYKMLGDNCAKLEYMVNGTGQTGA